MKTQSETTNQRSRMVERSPVYYGWLIVIAATLGMMMTSPGQTYGVSVFLDHMIDELGLSRSTVSLVYTIGSCSTARFSASRRE